MNVRLALSLPLCLSLLLPVAGRTAPSPERDTSLPAARGRQVRPPGREQAGSPVVDASQKQGAAAPANSDPQSGPAGRRLKLGDELTPGDYVLQVVVVDRLAQKSDRQLAAQWIDFEIVD